MRMHVNRQKEIKKSLLTIFYCVKTNLKRNGDSKNKNGTVEYLRREVFYGKERIKEI